jgi:hypothetical protein
MQSSASLKPKAHRRYVRCRRHHRPPDRTLDHHLLATIAPAGASTTEAGTIVGLIPVVPSFLRIVIVVGVIDDDYLAVTRRSEDVVVEVVEKLFAEFLTVRSVNNKRRMAAHWGRPRGTALLEHW